MTIIAPHPGPENFPDSDYAPPRAVAIFVRRSLDILSATGSEYVDDELSEHDSPVYTVEDIPYDPRLTPSLAPFSSCKVNCMDGSRMGGFSLLMYNFMDAVDGPGQEQLLEKEIMLFDDGTVSESVILPPPTQNDLEALAQLAATPIERLNELGAHAMGRLGIEALIDEIEGIPQPPAQLTYEELADLIKLLPQA